jgi:hypothetical protein
MKRALLFAAALIAAPVEAQSLGDRLRALPREEPVFQALNLADAVTTIDALHHGASERNPFLGKHPSDEAVIGQTVAIGVIHAAGTMFLQDHAPRFVKLWEIFSIGIKGGAVVNNLVVRF